MIQLPRGNPVKENIRPGQVNLPAALDRLRCGRFSGYLHFVFADSTAAFVFQNGRLISAVYASPRERQLDCEAMALTFAASRSGDGALHVYRLAPELALNLHDMLHGAPVLSGRELRQVNVPALLARMHDERHSGSLHVYTPRTAVLIFYRDGRPLGFFHDGAAELETTADLSRSVAREPGARIDVLLHRKGTGQPPADLLDVAPACAWWNAAAGGQGAQAGEARAQGGQAVSGS